MDSDKGKTLNNLRDTIQKIQTRDRCVDSHGITAQTQLRSSAINPQFNGSFTKTQFGEIFETQATIRASSIYGKMRLSDFLDSDPQITRELFGINCDKGLDIRRSLFLDIEIGMNPHGHRPFAFIIGLGFFRERNLIIRQILARDYFEEAASLDLLRRYIKKHPSIITYNGAKFDIPMLLEAMRINNINCAIAELIHIDLLPYCRKIWKDIHSNCKLATLEREIAGFSRQHSPEFLNLEPFTQTANERRLRKLKKILIHNYYDISSMVILVSRIAQLADFGSSCRENPVLEECLAISKLLLNNQHSDKAIEFLSKAACSHTPFSYKAHKELSLMLKKRKSFKEAAEIWEKMVDKIPEGDKFDAFPLIELAKSHEHRQKNYARAESIIQTAMSLCPKNHTNLSNALIQRLKRLQTKKNKIILE